MNRNRILNGIIYHLEYVTIRNTGIEIFGRMI